MQHFFTLFIVNQKKDSGVRLKSWTYLNRPIWAREPELLTISKGTLDDPKNARQRAFDNAESFKSKEDS